MSHFRNDPSNTAILASLTELHAREAGAAVALAKPQAYPGHPVCIAVSILERYSSFAQAARREEDAPPAALRDVAIRGAGGNVYAALDLLKYWLDGHVEHALAAAARYWETSAQPFGDARVAEGDAQAQAQLPRLRELMTGWPAA